MTRQLADKVLRQVPGWQYATLKELPGGMTNRSWLVEKDGERAVLKIDDKVRDLPHGSRLEEAAVQTQAAASGLANAVLYADEVTLMTEYVAGTVLDPAALGKDDNIERVAGALQRVHSLPLSGRTFDAMVAAQRYASRIESHDVLLAAHCTKLIESVRRPLNLCCCHNDLVAANIIATPDIMFLDWEYACDNDPLFDLATVVEHHDLSGELVSRLLDTYFAGNGERWREKLAEQQLLYRALYWLWLAARPDTDADELETAASRILP
ncbi:MAG: phosphotransferase [Woeseiaceae bacterium]|nr:phosphotransferase [Woeseiaceae bacterium]